MSFSGTKGYRTKPQPGVMLNSLHPLSRGLMGYWLFNEGAGSIAHDISGHGRHGTLTNMSPNAQDSGWGGSQFGGGLLFDYVDDMVLLGDKVDVANELTIAAWVNFAAATSSTIVSNKRFQAAGYMLFRHSGNYLRFSTGDGVNSDDANSPSVSWATNRWYHVVVTFRSPEVVFYRDGTVFGTDTMTWTGDIATAPYNMYFGSDPTPGVRLDGGLDEVRIYNRALAASEVMQLYSNPFCNLLRTPLRRYYVPAAGPVGAIMNQFQNFNIGADLYNGAIIA